MPDLDDDLGGLTVKRDSVDKLLGFARDLVPLALNDFACEDDVFKVEDCETVIFKLVCGMGRDDVAERPNQMAKVTDGHLGHDQVYAGGAPRLLLCGLTLELSRPLR